RSARVPGRGVAVAGADGHRGAQPSRPGVPRLPRQHPVQTDRAALRAVLGPSAAALVPPAGDADRVAAGDAGAALGAAGLAPAPAPPRRALPLADRLVAAGGAVLLDPERQARRLHPAGDRKRVVEG